MASLPTTFAPPLHLETPRREDARDPAELWLELARWPADELDAALLRALSWMLVAADAQLARASIVYREPGRPWRQGCALRAHEDGVLERTPRSRAQELTPGFWSAPELEALRQAPAGQGQPLRLDERGVALARLELTARVEVGFGLDLEAPASAPRAARALTRTLRGLADISARWCMSFGLLVGDGHLAPRLHQALTYLLTGLSEKEIAWEMDLSPASLHQYVVEIYRHLGVQSRAELMALWLRSPLPQADLG